MTEKQSPWPYNLPIWRSFYRATSPDGRRVAQIDPALEMGMSNPTSGLLCVTGGPHIERCSPSIWFLARNILAMIVWLRHLLGWIVRSRKDLVLENLARPQQ